MSAKKAGQGSIKVCWWCEHFNYSSGSPGYSEYTPGYSMTMECGKKRWGFDAEMTSQEEFGEMLQSATTCSDFAKKVLV